MSEGNEKELARRIEELEAELARAGARATELESLVAKVGGARKCGRPGPEDASAVGTLCEGIAHEFNNLLARIMASAEDAMESEVSPAVAANLRTIIDACEKAGRICEGLLSYAGRRPLNLRRVSPVKLMEHTLQILEKELLDAGVEVVRDYQAIPDMMLDNAEMGKVFANLITNACHAMSGGGRLSVSCGVEAGEIVIRFRDTGSGIAPEMLPRLFQPFVTTKGALAGSDVEGMGLGLSAARGIVGGHGGTIGVESTPGRGTTVTIRLPVERQKSGGTAETDGGKP